MKSPSPARAALLGATLISAGLYAGCRCEDGPEVHGRRTIGEPPASSGHGGSDTAGADGAGGAGGQDGPACGGIQGNPCPFDRYCDYSASATCGAGDAMGVCLTRPELCAQDCPGACACDGTAYCNECMVRAAGTDVAPRDSCKIPGSCEALAQVIASKTSGVRMCTSVVRLDYLSHLIKSYRIACAPLYVPTEAGARMRAQIETGFGENAQLISGSSPADELVFWEAPAEAGGGVAVVSARNGASVFGGSIFSGGDGHITYPVAFQPGAWLSPGCPTKTPLPGGRGFDLRDGKPLSAPDIAPALEAVSGTALPAGIAEGAAVLDVMVLLYAPAVAPFDSTEAEWIVLVNSGPQ